jgi:predicted GNAT family N-acyltransferase
MRLVEPSAPSDFETYYDLRWKVLREPWSQPRGSEKDDAENSSIHVMAIDEHGECVGVGRLQMNSPHEAQVRFMGVREDQQGKGVGKMIMHYLELKAAEAGAKKIILQARENAVKFYESLGYSITEKTFKLWNLIQHWKMEKAVSGHQVSGH